MLPLDAPFLETALALLALPFRPVTAGVSPVSAGLLPTPLVRSSASASCQAHVIIPAMNCRAIFGCPHGTVNLRSGGHP